MIILNSEVLHCHRCGSEELEILGIDDYEETYKVWCTSCHEETLEDVIKANKTKIVNFNYDKELYSEERYKAIKPIEVKDEVDSKWVCPTCKSEVGDNVEVDNFCRKCGQKILFN